MAIEEQKALKIIKLYNKGIPITELAKIFNIGRGTISNLLKANNIEIKTLKFYIKKFTNEDEAIVIELYPKLSVEKIAEKFNVSYQVIIDVFKKHNIKTRTAEQRRKLSPDDEKEISDLYNKGYSSIELGVRFGLRANSIRYILNRNGVEIRNSHKTKNPNNGFKIKLQDHIKIIKKYKEGLTEVKVAELFGVKPQTIRRILRKYNIKTRSAVSYSIKLTAQKKKEIINLYSKGMSSPEIANVLDIGTTSIARTLKANNVKTRPTNFYTRKFDSKQEKEIISFYKQGNSVNGVARKFGTTFATIRSILVRNNSYPMKNS
jgi:transposase